MSLPVTIGVILLGMVTMWAIICIFEKLTREAEQAIDDYYEDIHSLFYEEDD